MGTRGIDQQKGSSMNYTQWEQYEINLIRHYHGEASTDEQIAEVLRIRLDNMRHDQWSQPSNRRAGEMLDVENLIKKLSKDTVNNAA